MTKTLSTNTDAAVKDVRQLLRRYTYKTVWKAVCRVLMTNVGVRKAKTLTEVMRYYLNLSGLNSSGKKPRLKVHERIPAVSPLPLVSPIRPPPRLRPQPPYQAKRTCKNVRNSTFTKNSINRRHWIDFRFLVSFTKFHHWFRYWKSMSDSIYIWNPFSVSKSVLIYYYFILIRPSRLSCSTIIRLWGDQLHKHRRRASNSIISVLRTYEWYYYEWYYYEWYYYEWYNYERWHR